MHRTKITWRERFARTWAIMGAARHLLARQKTLLFLPIASSICLIALTVAWALPWLFGALFGVTSDGGSGQGEAAVSLWAGLSYVATYAIGIFFNAALAICVLHHLDGKPVSIATGIGEAVGVLPQILGWALISATVGTLLQALERRFGFVGRLVLRLIGLAWTVATFLVVPVLVAERKGPLDAVQESVRLLRRTWGEDLLSGMGFGALYVFLSIPAALVFMLGASLITAHPALAVIVMLLAVLYVPLLALVLSTLSTIFDVVLYRYAKQGLIAPGFNQALLDSAFASKQS